MDMDSAMVADEPDDFCFDAVPSGEKEIKPININVEMCPFMFLAIFFVRYSSSDEYEFFYREAVPSFKLVQIDIKTGHKIPVVPKQRYSMNKSKLLVIDGGEAAPSFLLGKPTLAIGYNIRFNEVYKFALKCNELPRTETIGETKLVRPFLYEWKGKWVPNKPKNSLTHA